MFKDNYELKIADFTLESYWQELINIGWLSDTPLSFHRQLRADVEEMYNRNPVNTCFGLANTVLDAECIYEAGVGKQSYSEKIKMLADSSSDLFSPSQISDDYVNEYLSIYVSFLLNGKLYDITVEASKWFSCEVLDLINEALKEQKVANRFISLPNIDQCYFLVFVSEKTFFRAQEKWLIPPPMYFWYKNEKPEQINNYLVDFRKNHLGKTDYRVCEKNELERYYQDFYATPKQDE